MIVIFAIFLAALVTNGQGKHIKLLSHEQFEEKLSRRSESNENNNSKQVNSEETHKGTGNRDDKSYIPDVDLASAGINRRGDTGNGTEDNEPTLPLHEESITNDDNSKNTKEGDKINHQINTLNFGTLTGYSNDTILTDESATNSNIDTTIKENANVYIIADNQVFTTTAQNTPEVNTATIDNSAVTQKSSIDEPLETVLETTSNILTLTTVEDQSTKKPKNKISTANEIENVTKSEQCINCYKVYEIGSPTKGKNQQFLRNPEPMKGQSHSVPVYEFLPNFANNSKINFGPNKTEDTSKIMKLDTFQLHERNIDVNAIVKASESVSDFNINLRKFNNKGILKGSKRTHETKTNIGRIFDDLNINMLPELMLAKSGKSYTYNNLVDLKKSKIDRLFSFAKLKDMIVQKRSNIESKISIHMDVIKDLILEDSKALQQYDWLVTTVQVRSALTKILELINHTRHSVPIHPADLQILKYIVFLHNFALGVKEEKKLNNKLENRAELLPRHRKKRKNKLLKEKSLIDRVWLRRSLLTNMVDEDDFSHLYEFVIKVQDGLFDLHEAIRQIAGVTKFGRQNWYNNLKQLYLSADEKQLRELLLHMTMSKLIDLIEHSCRKGVDQNFVHFLETHEKDAKKIVEELLFIDEIVDDIGITM